MDAPSDLDIAWMRRAIELSRLGYPAPNPHVGCVIASGQKLLGEGFHEFAGGPHAEVVALAQAGDKARGATAYVTLEPCNHIGRTGPCSEALLNAGIARVVVAVPEPSQRASGGLNRLGSAGVATSTGLLEAEAASANELWLTAVKRRRPYVVGKAGISLDGRIALEDGQSQWITGIESRTKAHELRAECGAVLVGRKTVEQDDPELTVRFIETLNQPTRIVLDGSGKLPADAKAFNDRAPFIRVVNKAEREHDLELQADSGGFDLPDLLERLYEQGITSLLVEGGAETLGSFLTLNLIDRLELFMAPKILGNGPTWTTFRGVAALADAREWAFSDPKRLGHDLWITARSNPVNNGNDSID